MAFVGGIGAAGLFPGPAASTQILREDLLDAAINLDKQKKAAVFLAAPKTVANGMVHEWLIDNLPVTSTAGSVEGNQWASAGDAQKRTRLSNIVQTFNRPFAVTLDQVEYSLKGRAPGVSNEYEHQVENFLLAVEQSIDARMVANGTSLVAVSAGASDSVALMGAMRNYMLSGTNVLPSAGTGVSNTIATNNVKIEIGGAWSRSKFLQLHEFMFKIGADPDTLAVSPGVKADITDDVLGNVVAVTATGAAAGYASQPVMRQLHTDSSGTEFTQDIQFMRTDFGRVAILVDRYIPESATGSNALVGGAYFLYERSKVRVAFWRPLRHYPLPADGDYMRGYIHAGVTVEQLHPNTVGIGYNVTT